MSEKGFSLIKIFPIKERIKNSVLKRKFTGQKNIVSRYIILQMHFKQDPNAPKHISLFKLKNN